MEYPTATTLMLLHLPISIALTNILLMDPYTAMSRRKALFYSYLNLGLAFITWFTITVSFPFPLGGLLSVPMGLIVCWTVVNIVEIRKMED
jgi:hypothetical protein